MRGHCAAVAAYDCEAPAGFATARGVASCPQKTGLHRCPYCGEPVCGPCSTEVEGRRVCLTHEPEELAGWLGLPERVPSQLTQTGVVSSPMDTDQTTDEDGPSVLNVQQAAQALSVSKATLIRKIQTRQIRATKLPGKTGAFVIAAVDLAPHRPPVSRCDRHRWATNGSDSCPRCHSEAQRS